MADFSINYNLELPDFDVVTWHEELNNNLKILDAIVASVTGITGFLGSWGNSTAYVIGNRVVDNDLGNTWQCLVDHTSAASPTTFLSDRTTNPTYWGPVTVLPSVRGEWANDTLYAAGDVAQDSSENLYAVCTITHTSSAAAATMRTDAANWDYIADLKTDVDAAAASAVAAAASEAAAAASTGLEIQTFTATLAQTVFNLTGGKTFDTGVFATIVTYNGTVLTPTTDYVQTDLDTITLQFSAELNAIVNIIFMPN